MDKKFQIFISSTYEDLKEERSKLVATILKAGHFPIGMEMFSADNIEKWEQIKQAIDKSDYYILIIKRRYGSLCKENISFTKKEYLYAKSSGIPVLAFILGRDATVSADSIETDFEKLKLLFEFIDEVENNCICDYWSTPDNLCTQVLQALEKQFRTNPQMGWVQSNVAITSDSLPKLKEEELLEWKANTDRELLKRKAINSDSFLTSDFFETIRERIWNTINRGILIDTFERNIVLEINNELSQVKVSITTRIEYLSIGQEAIYYSSNPRFETEEHAKSYRTEEFRVNNIDLTQKVVSKVYNKDQKRQFPYLVKNTFPLDYEKTNPIILHKTTHIVPIENFLQVYQLIYPCRTFLVSVLIKEKTSLHEVNIGAFSSFNVHNNPEYIKEFRRDDINSIKILKWALPGSGYVISLENNNCTN